MEFLPAQVREAVQRLDLRLPTRSDVPEIEVLLNRTVLKGGKRLRPALCFLMGSLFGLGPEAVAPYARAAELTHAASLSHDDVIDEARSRRGHPTLNKVAGNARAVLAGDLLLARVMVEVSLLGNLDIIRDLSGVVEELVGGEWLQLEARGVAPVDRGHLTAVAGKKTASLLRFCCVVPARLGDAGDGLRERCAELGTALGVGFQMMDDLLDFAHTSEKPYAQDLREGLLNFVALEMIERSPALLPPIAAILREPARLGDGAWPWTGEQLDQAKEAVRGRVAAKLALARVQLDSIVAEVTPRTDPQREAAASLVQLLRFIGERSR